MIDGTTDVYFRFYNFQSGQYASIRSFVFDFGGPKTLTRMRACSVWTGRFAFSFYVSATGADDDWQLFKTTTDMMSTADKQWLEFPLRERTWRCLLCVISRLRPCRLRRFAPM